MKALAFAALLATSMSVAGVEPLDAAGSRHVLEALQRYCLPHESDFRALDRLVPQSEPGAVALTQAEIDQLLAHSDDAGRGYVIAREPHLLWLTWSPDSGCAVSGRSTDGAALVSALATGLRSTTPNHFMAAGLDITTFRFGRGETHAGAMVILFRGRSARRDLPFSVAFIPAGEVRRTWREYAGR